MENKIVTTYGIEKAVGIVNTTYRRVLVDDNYEEYSLKALISALSFLLEEANKK